MPRMSTDFVDLCNAMDGGLSNLVLGNSDMYYTWCVRPESRPARHADILVNIDM